MSRQEENEHSSTEDVDSGLPKKFEYRKKFLIIGEYHIKIPSKMLQHQKLIGWSDKTQETLFLWIKIQRAHHIGTMRPRRRSEQEQ